MLLSIDTGKTLTLLCWQKLNEHKSRFMLIWDWDSLSSAGLIAK